jgi:hypothetical protein
MHMGASSLRVENNVEATMRDGTVLRADVYRPAKPGSYPVLLNRTPYIKTRDSYAENAMEMAERGYIAVVQDKRGRGESDGEWTWQFLDRDETTDGPDGYDTVEWAARLPESDGQVGTWGHSYPSWCIWMLAAEQPPSLKAIYPTGMNALSTDLNFGIFETGRRLQWSYRMAVDARHRVGEAMGPKTEAQAEAEWAQDHRYKWIWFLPLIDLPDELFHDVAPLLKKYMKEQEKETWRFDTTHHQVNVPTATITGWYDRLVGTIKNFSGMVENGPEHLRSQHRLVIGPWGHNVANMGRHQGPLDFGDELESTFVDELLRWYDYYLKGIDTSIADEPPIKMFIMGDNTWRFENEWPLARTQFTEFFIHSGGSANSVSGDGSLSTTGPSDEPPDKYDYDPRDPVMSLMAVDSQAAPRDQSFNDHRRDVLVYQTPPLSEDIEVTGPVVLKIWAASSAPDTDFAAKLIDVHPDGLAVNLTYGIMRARYRDGYDNPRLIEPGRPYEYTINLNPTGIVFKKGHRIRLDIASSDFPNFDRNHNTGNDWWSDTELRVAHQTIFHDAERPSRLVLPVIPK